METFSPYANEICVMEKMKSFCTDRSVNRTYFFRMEKFKADT